MNQRASRQLIVTGGAGFIGSAYIRKVIAETDWQIVGRGRVAETYNIGGNAEPRNIDLVRTLCAILDRLLPESPHRTHERLIAFVPDRPSHGRRYAIDAGKIASELGWRLKQSLEGGLERTVRWYLENRAWWQAILDRKYDAARLGLGAARKSG